VSLPRAAPRCLRAALALAAALTLAVWGTWPVTARLGSHVYVPASNDAFATGARADTYLTLWILAWDAHSLLTKPGALLDANIFHPAPRTLALAEHMLGVLPLYLPVAVATQRPVLAHQLTLVLTFALAFLAALALVVDWTGSWSAGAVAGLLFAFSPLRGADLGGLQVLTSYHLPLIPLCARRALDGRGWLWPALLAATLVLQALSSYYVGYAAFAAFAAIGAVVLAASPHARRRWWRLALPAAGAAVVVGVSALPYVAWRRAGVLAAPSPLLLRFFAAKPGHTGATPALVLALGTLPFWRRGLRRDVAGAWLVALAATGVLGHALALGPSVEISGRSFPAPFGLVSSVVPGLGVMRGTSRFNTIATMALAALAGIGVAGATRALDGRLRHVPTGLALAFATLAVGWGLPRPVPIKPVETRGTLPLAYRRLAAAPAGPLLEVPLLDPRLPGGAETETLRMYRSIYHWQPLLNGYSGHVPPSHAAVAALAGSVPDARALRLLARTTGLRWILVHQAELTDVARRRWRSPPRALAHEGTFGDDLLFSIRDPPEPDLEPALLDAAPRATTLLGVPCASLALHDRLAAVALSPGQPAPKRPGLAFTAEVKVRNTSDAVWPALATRADHLLMLAYRWEDREGRVVAEDVRAGRLAYDLAPAASLRVPLVVVAPLAPGSYRLVVGVSQDGAWLQGRRATLDARLGTTP
jgi:hypothetical protein